MPHYKKFPYKQEVKADKVRKQIETLKAKIDAEMHAAWKRSEPVDHNNPAIAKLIKKAKKLCHWNSHHVKIKDGNDVIETNEVCMCPGKDFIKCSSAPDCYGHGAFEFDISEDD